MNIEWIKEAYPSDITKLLFDTDAEDIMNTTRLLLMILLTICQVPVKKKVNLKMTELTYRLKQISVSLVRADSFKYAHN